jgi:pilus assembly protein CpaF
MTAPAVLTVVVTEPDGRRRSMTLTADKTLWLGRDPACQIVLDSKRVSRRHAALDVEGSGLRITDTSSNGTTTSGVVLHGENRLLGGCAKLEILPFSIDLALGSLGDVPQEHGGAPPVAVLGPLRRRIHRLLLEHMDLSKTSSGELPQALGAAVVAALERIVDALAQEIPPEVSRTALVQELRDEALGLGPLEPLLADPRVSEIMVVDPETIFVEREGRIARTRARFTDAESVRSVIERIVMPLGRRIDESSPLVDARLADGSRVNAVIPPLAVRGPCITIRRFHAGVIDLEHITRMGSMTERMAAFLSRSVRARRNIVVSGGTGSGKTTLLNALSTEISKGERIVTIEDAAELRLAQPHVVSLEARPPNREGKGAYSIRDLLKNALRMRPDRVVVGECRGGEAIDMLQAMNTGHEGSMTTLHANSPREAIARIETLCLMSDLELPVLAIRAQIAASVHLVVQQARFSDGSRRVVSIAEVTGLDDTGAVRIDEIFRFERTGTGGDGAAIGEFLATGYVPSFVDAFMALGLASEDECL